MLTVQLNLLNLTGRVTLSKTWWNKGRDECALSSSLFLKVLRYFGILKWSLTCRFLGYMFLIKF